MKVCVLKGGTSPERDISLKTGKAVAQALREKGFFVSEIDVVDECWNWLEKHVDWDCDVFFIALHGGLGESGEVQRFFEDRGVVFTGSGSRASFNAMNKAVARRIFSHLGLEQMRHVVFARGEKVFLPEFNFPLVVKPVDAGSSVGLTVVRDPDEYLPAIQRAFEVSGSVMVEEFVVGRELTVGILGEKTLEPIEIRPKVSDVFDYDSKYTKGKTDYIIPAMIPEEDKLKLREIAWRAFSGLGCRDFGRVDMILSEDGIYVLEVNTIPGMTELSLLPMAAEYEGINFPELCEWIVNLAWNRYHGKKS